MPSVKLDLGKFVQVKGPPRADGTCRVLFEVPARLRPCGWSPSIPLPVQAPRTGDLTNADEVGRIQVDAARLYQAYLAARAGRDAPPEPDARTLKTLIAAWERSESYRATKPRTQKGYDYLAREIQAWADAHPRQPDPTLMRKPDVEAFLRIYDDRPTQKWQVKKALRMVMQQAVDLGWRADNPVANVKVAMPKTSVEIWEAADVEAHVFAAAFLARQPWVAALILTEWEIGQRLTDAILWKRTTKSDQEGYLASEGAFRFRQSKTSGTVAIPVSDRLRAVLEACKVEDSLFLFHDGATGLPFPEVDRLSHVFEEIRAHVLAADPDARHLLLRALRHSCVVQLARAGAEVPEIAAITGHAIQSVATMLSTYLPRDTTVARNAQRKRGLVTG